MTDVEVEVNNPRNIYWLARWETGKPLTIKRRLARLKQRGQLLLYEEFNIPIGIICSKCGNILHINSKNLMFEDEMADDGYHNLIPFCMTCMYGEVDDE